MVAPFEPSLAHIDFRRRSLEAYYGALEAAAQRFAECGVTVDRMAMVTYKGSNRTDLAIDGVSRFSVELRW